MKVTERWIARHALTNPVWWQTVQCEIHPARREEAQAVVASLREFRLTWRRNTKIQMNWLWKRLESQSNCIFSRWKDKCLLHLLFCIPTFFKTFQDYGRGGTVSLASPDGTSLICIHYRSAFFSRRNSRFKLTWENVTAVWYQSVKIWI